MAAVSSPNFRPLSSPPRPRPSPPRAIPSAFSPGGTRARSDAQPTTSPTARRTSNTPLAAARNPLAASTSSGSSGETSSTAPASSATTLEAVIGAGADGKLGGGQAEVSKDGKTRSGSRRASASARIVPVAAAAGAASSRGSSVARTRGRDEAYLPAGMDVRQALARCEDPGLSWSLQFWVTIADPVHVFFACPASGQCSWDPPVGAFVVPRSPDGEWWELADPNRGNRSYYYNTLTGQTQWLRPEGDAFVIPLGLIQQSALPERPAGAHSQTGTSSGSRGRPQPILDTAHVAPPLHSPATTPRRAGSKAGAPGSARSPLASAARTGPASPATPTTPTRGRAGPRASVPVSLSLSSLVVNQGKAADAAAAADKDAAPAPARDRTWWDRRKTVVKSITSPRKAAAGVPDTPVLRAGDAPVPTQPEPQMSVQTKRMSSGPHPLLRPDLTSEIQAFQSGTFADGYFATRRAGVLRQRVPLERILEWQRAPLSRPLLVLSKPGARDATSTFKVIQHVMGERTRAVEGARVLGASGAGRDARGGGARDGKDGKEGAAAAEKTRVLDEVRWMVQLGVVRGEMRDEIYAQCIKQLTKNPDSDAVVLGFQLLCVLVAAFVPSKDFEGFVKAFLRRPHDGALGVMAQYCERKIDAMIANGGRGRVLTLGEIEHASDAAFYPSVYGQSLETVLRLQKPSYPDLAVPIILPFLADGILALGGLEAEGIFRVPGDGDCVGELRARIDRGHYQLTGIDDPHVAASLFKLWLRELEHPLVPADTYDAALAAAATYAPDDAGAAGAAGGAGGAGGAGITSVTSVTSATTPAGAAACIDVVRALPPANRRVLAFVVSFLQLFLRPDVVARTRMGAPNLALVTAPNILRSPSSQLETAFTNSAFEARFVLALLRHLDPADVEPGYRPRHGAAPARAS